MLAFLFTDLESSTRMWEAYPDRMGAALAEHDRILRQAVEGCSGTVVKSTGDGMLAIFDSVPRCLAACVEAQRGLGAAEWQTPEPLRVRMGVHVGEAEARAGDYFGTDVNRAARIMAAGHGGQVLVSDAVAALVTEVELRDLGRHRLKDLTEPAHLFQVVAAGLDADFPPLATLTGVPNNLPVQVSEFIGREEVLAAASELLGREGVRLVTLLGPGGTGKTRLALQVAAEALERYPDGVFFVDLSEERSPDGAFETVVRELGLVGAREGTPLQVLKAKLHEGRRLLVLDNLEQVTDIGPGVAELLAFCPGLEVVGTSRETLHIRGEHSFPVPTLGLADPHADPDRIADAEAVRLFVDRARAVRPDFELDAANAGVVAEITAQLDGLPLAIELAAARLQVFDPAQLRDRLADRADVLGRGTRDLPDRQRTLRGAVEWSYELLDTDECRLFELISIFPSARLEAIEAVAGECHPDMAVVDVLTSLVAKSLVRRVDDGGSRFSMLRIIREYATERLGADPATEAAARQAHARYFTSWAEAAGGAVGTTGVYDPPAEVVDEMANLQLAWRLWAAASDVAELARLFPLLWAVADARGWYHAAMGLDADLLAIVEATGDPGPFSEASIRTRHARSLMAVRGYTPAVETEFEAVLGLVQEDDVRARGPVLRALATYHMNTGDFAEAARKGAELVELGTASGEDAPLVEGHVVLGAMTPDLASAIGHLDRAIEVWDRTSGGSRYRLGASAGIVARMASAILLTRVGRIDGAVARATEGLEEARRSGHPFSVAYALHHAGYFWLWMGRPDETIRHAAELGEHARRHDYPIWLALGSIMEGVGRAGVGEGESALALSESGLELYHGLTTPPVFWAPLQAVRALGYLAADAPAVALPLIDEAASMPGIEAIYPEFQVLRGDIRGRLGDDVGAVDAYRVAADGALVAGATLIELSALRRLVELGETGQERLGELHAALVGGGDHPELTAAGQVLAR